MPLPAQKSLFHRLHQLSPWRFLAVLLLLIAISYSNSIYSPFALDDAHSFIAEPNIYIHNYSWASLQQLGQTEFGYKRIIPLLTFAIDHHFFKLTGSIAQYHFTNIVIHLFATLALFLFLRGLLRIRGVRNTPSFLPSDHFCLFVTALWALSPIHTNAVTYLVQRMTSLAALFYFSSLASYLYARSTPLLRKKIVFFFLFIFFATCGMLSKENTATLPLAVLLIEGMFIAPTLPNRLWRNLRWYHLALAAFLFLTILPIAEKPWQQMLATYEGRHFTLGERLLTETRVVVHYLSLLALPLPGRLNLDYDFPVSTSLLEPVTTLPSIVLLGILMIGAIRYRKAYPLFCFGVFWFFLNLAIESTVVPLELIFEHRLYLPSVGFFVAIISLVDLTATRLQHKIDAQKLLPAIFLAVIILVASSSTLTTLRNNDWRDLISIYQDCVTKSPLKPRAHVNLGYALSESGHHDEAIASFEEGIRLGRRNYNEYNKAANNIVVDLIEQGKLEEAVTRGKQLVKNMPALVDDNAFPKFLYNLGFAYQKLGKYNLAFAAYTDALKFEEPKNNLYLRQGLIHILNATYDNRNSRHGIIFPHSKIKQAAIFSKMTQLMLENRDYDAARQYITHAESLEPDNKEIQRFLEEYLKTVRKNEHNNYRMDIGNHPPFNNDLAYRSLLTAADFIYNHYSPLHGTIGWLLQRVNNKYPDDPFVILRLSQWHLLQNRKNTALDILQKGLTLYPDFVPFLEQLVRIYQ
ncbi:MAG: hypothetical protein OEV91_02305, partial [Desulfobulbaceae bacterium]|nr:hypothetical protein [Desulfobulbaceae bacterium]